jgi:arylsulfatase A-like enzyme
MTRRDFFITSTALGVTRAADQRPPNIVFIMADDLGYGDLGCYGQKIIQTPNIDKLAHEGMRFTDAYAGCTVCAPSRSVLMTGLHMGHTSVRSNPGGVPLLASDFTVAEMLKQAGYSTGCFGKWGLGDIGTDGVPWKQGFDEFFGYLHQVHAHFYYPEFLYKNKQRYPLEGNTAGKRTTYSHDVIAGQALDFIRRYKDKPFFCYVPFTLPHLELLVPEDSMSPYEGKLEEKAWTDPRKHYADQPRARAAYAGMISRMDRDVGRILSLLKELGLEQNTVVFFTSDNGAAMRIWNEDYFHSTGGLRGHKQNLYEGGIRAPMIVRWPGRIPQGSQSSFAWASWDVMPTLAAICGGKVPGKIDGISVLPTLLGKQQDPRPFLYWELPRYDNATKKFRDETPMQAGRMGTWKVVRPEPDGALELYNLTPDPHETRNVASDYPKILDRIKAHLAISRVPPRRQAMPEPDFEKPG